MRKIKITLPATATSLGPGLNSLGLALGLYCTVEVSERRDETLLVETEGEGAGHYPVGLRHPVVLGMMRVFQQQERAPLGLTVRINSRIPPDSGLGAEAAFWVAGIIAANNILNNPYARPQVLEMAARYSRQPDSAVTTILGGLTASLLDGDTLIYRAFSAAPLTVAVVLPELHDYAAEVRRGRPERIPMADALYNLSRAPLLAEALRAGDLSLIAQVLHDKLRLPHLKPHIPGYDRAVDVALRTGAAAVTLSGDGPAIIAFADSDHRRVATTMEVAFENVGVKARSWVLPVDTQGVVVSVAGS
ncbi:MAG: homoserine kinase [Chloroflexi bacterium]|nr:homoserine kinase [Chloroflexota bacterium]